MLNAKNSKNILLKIRLSLLSKPFITMDMLKL